MYFRLGVDTMRRRKNLYPIKSEKYLLKISIVICLILIGVQFLMLNHNVRSELSIVDKLEGTAFDLNK